MKRFLVILSAMCSLLYVNTTILTYATNNKSDAHEPSSSTTTATQSNSPHTQTGHTRRIPHKNSQPQANQPQANQPQANQPPANQPPANQPPANQPPANQPPANQPPANQPPANQPPANQQPSTKKSQKKNIAPIPSPPIPKANITEQAEPSEEEPNIPTYVENKSHSNDFFLSIAAWVFILVGIAVVTIVVLSGKQSSHYRGNYFQKGKRRYKSKRSRSKHSPKEIYSRDIRRK